MSVTKVGVEVVHKTILICFVQVLLKNLKLSFWFSEMFHEKMLLQKPARFK